MRLPIAVPALLILTALAGCGSASSPTPPQASQPALRPDAGVQTPGVRPSHFLGSGHAPGHAGDGRLGLISSTDGGRRWDTLVLGGDADIHTLRSGTRLFYAQDASQNRLFVGDVRAPGLSRRTSPPGTTIDLAVDPRSDERVFATTDRGFYLSEDEARNWTRIDRRRTGFMAFVGRTLVMVDVRGQVSSLSRLGRPWQLIGLLSSPPVALTTQRGRLIAADIYASIYTSDDGGRTWDRRLKGPSVP